MKKCENQHLLIETDDLYEVVKCKIKINELIERNEQIINTINSLVAHWNKHMEHHGLLDYVNDLIDRKNKEDK